MHGDGARGARRALVTAPLLAVAVAWTSGCPKEQPPGFDENDRTILKLRAEQARLDQQATLEAKRAAQPDPLAEAAVRQAPATRLALPQAAPVQVEGVTVTLKQLEAAQTVSGPKTSLSTADRFIKVTLSAVAATEARLELAGATLREGGRSFGLARDAQRLGGGAPLQLTVGSASQDIVIFFEAPPDAIKKGLTLVLPAATGGVDVPLQ